MTLLSHVHVDREAAYFVIGKTGLFKIKSAGTPSVLSVLLLQSCELCHINAAA